MEKEEKITAEKENLQKESQQAKKPKEKKEPTKKTSGKTKKITRSRKNKSQEKLEQLQQEAGELKDKYLRLSAEFDNYRKRTLNEKIDLIKNASEKILLELLPVIDDFDRAIQANEKITDIDTVKEGEQLIYGKFKDLIKKQGVEEIEAIGQELNTDYHEALTKIPAPSEEMKGKIVDVVEKGYLLNDKVLRFAKVVIGE
ncbi:MAG: nucleotide exchange factor GrpE [Bacteroidales bacterium]|nr:nucleotide exchange factor GrpE [Bacteroidales bacterium]